ncbi:Ig-like domain-containing protein [uncultured Legionella sp.]|uniref:Ig-like domain-containing protein n=1 Tax=uncultured Legionella sp. TaxID=210934 RepID=UPI0026254E32|nr:Ig-like domain-containing protein [uncultured Legionella sp.]
MRLYNKLSNGLAGLKKKNNWLRCLIANVLIFVQLFHIAFAAIAPLPSSKQPNSSNHLSQVNYLPNQTLQMLSLNNKQLGMSGPLDLGITYSDLTGTYFNAQYALPIGEKLALNALGEYGSNQYRINGTVGYSLSELSQIKVTAERFDQRLPFLFDSGNIKSRVHQDAYGLRFQQLFNLPLIQGFNAGTYYAKADNKSLDPIIFSSNGSNCGGFNAGLQCINYRNIAGARSAGIDMGLDMLLAPSTLVSGNVYYDEVHYNTILSLLPYHNRNGIGAGIRINQLLNERIKIMGEATAREIYDTYQTGISWLPKKQKIGMELSLLGQYITSHNATPDNRSISLQISLFGDANKRYDERYPAGDQQLNSILQWTKTPAVKMQQVLAIAEQITKLLAPSIAGISPNNGPFIGGNIVTITGNNFVQGLLVYFGNQLAHDIQILSPTTITVTAPPGIDPANNVVDVTIQSPDGQKTTLVNGYIYLSGLAAPMITQIIDNTGSSQGVIPNGGTTDDTTPQIVGTGLSGATISIFNNGNLLATTSVDSTGSWSYTPTTPLVDGAHSFTAAQTDQTGSTSAQSAPYTINVNTIVPVAPLITAVFDDQEPVTGVIPDGGTTNDTTPQIAGTGLPNATVSLFTGNTLLGTTSVNNSGGWIFAITTPLGDGIHIFTATQSNASGTSPQSPPYTITVDTVAPIPPTISYLLDDVGPVQGQILNGGTTDDTTPQVVGTGSPNDTIRLYLDGNPLGTSTVLSDGSWSLFPTSSLANGPHILTATATDQAGNTSSLSSEFNFTIDTSIPLAPVITDIFDDTGPVTGTIPNNGTTDDAQPTLSGNGQPGATVSVFSNGNLLNTVPVDAFGNWLFIPASALADGNHVFTAIQTNQAGTPSPQSASYTITIDTN